MDSEVDSKTIPEPKPVSLHLETAKSRPTKDTSTAKPLLMKETMKKVVPRESETKSASSRSFMIPDTVPVTKSRPDVVNRDIPPKVDILPKFHLPRRADSPPKSFQELLTKFQTGETESRPTESKEKLEVQKEISLAFKLRESYLDDELKVGDKKRAPDLKREFEEVSLALLIYSY
jgi:hypothetical protein